MSSVLFDAKHPLNDSSHNAENAQDFDREPSSQPDHLQQRHIQPPLPVPLESDDEVRKVPIEVKASLPLCPCCPLQFGCYGLGAIQATWGILQTISVLRNRAAYPVPFLPVYLKSAFGFGSDLKFYFDIFSTFFTFVVGAYLVFAASRLISREVRDYIVCSGLSAAEMLLQGYLYILVLIDTNTRTRDAKPVPTGSIVVVVAVMVLDLTFRAYAIASAIKLWNNIPHRGRWWDF